MNLAFYNGSVGAAQQQKKLDVVANNIANVNTEGFKSQSATFVDMLYGNIHDKADAQTDLTAGLGARVEKTDINFEQGNLESTGNIYDMAINGSGFFAVYNMGTGEISYTRKGNFQMSEYGQNRFFLATENGEFVLDYQGQAIEVTGSDETDDFTVGVFDFQNYQGMLAKGNEYYQPVEKNGNPFYNDKAEVKQRFIEKSNASLADEMVKVIEAQRVYQANLRMISTADEIEQNINNLR